MSALHELSLTAVYDLIKTGRASPQELLADCFERIRLREPEVRAFSCLAEENALQQVAEMSAGDGSKPLSGIPVGIKDIMNTAQLPTTMGSPIYADYRPQRDAACVSMCKAAGAVVPGKTVTTEFAYFLPGKTRNPHNTQHTPGGSSMGSAAAVADCMLPFALGTQTAGSVIRPAAYCGVVGYKASHGLFSLEGVTGLAQSLDSLGFFVRDARDLDLLCDVFLGAAQSGIDGSTALRVGMVRTPHWNQLEDYQKKAIEAVCGQLTDLGCELGEVEIGPADGALSEAQATVMAYEASRSLEYEYREQQDQLSPQIIDLIETGRDTTFERYMAARRLSGLWQRKLEDVFENVDLLLAPSASGEAPKGLNATGDPVFSRMWTLLKVPTITLPTERGPNGLPLGIQLIGARGQDRRLISHARIIQDML